MTDSSGNERRITRRKQETRAFFETPHLASWRQGDPFFEEDYVRHLEEYLGEDLEKYKAGVWVDVGVGAGSKLHDAVVKAGIPLHNLDISLAAVRRHREPGVVGDAFNLPFADGSLQGLISSNLLNSNVLGNKDDPEAYFENIHDLVTEIARVLKPGGIFMQSHFGSLPGSSIAILNALVDAGFEDITPVSPLFSPDESRSKMQQNLTYRWTEPLAFIARKKATAL